MTRREQLSAALLFPSFAAFAADKQKLPSMMLDYEKLAVRTNAQNGNKSRSIFDGLTHTGSGIEIHETDLAPGQMPHAAHHHAHEEMVLIREGTLEVTISGKSSRLGPGSVAYVASNEEHGWKNVGEGRAKYFVIAVGKA